ncbi:MAG: CpsD/CapB family tyrosine-protein kinase [Bradyrhizobium sp.]|uniref:CpsD/CapB family tyrosine-protein kinase n=1 Tax=Bradyrhizobium sp. TaxID=376 RepID=UPI0025BD5BB0|nr:CpsD/CapB family tyrosine-protein kinase [Bradyrhizobium sp.]MBI5263408.1 CpsD/CapB family tyrosine-protein kinase [Bradyrhizobium sp.]
MDSIKQAIELARGASTAPRQTASANFRTSLPQGGAPEAPVRDMRLDPNHLDANRIVAHGASGQSGRYYDMLRTQVLQEMDKNSWQFLAVTSPTAGCGKTVTACNLAMSIARLPERPVMLVDLDLRKPTIANYLGLDGTGGVLNVLEGRTSLSSAALQARVGPNSLVVLPGSVPSPNASEWMASQAMAMLLEAIKRDFRSRIVIFDLPPMLLADDVISILPRMDAMLLIAGVGSTSVADLKECQKHLQGTPVARVVVNKVTETTDSYCYGYY